MILACVMTAGCTSVLNEGNSSTTAVTDRVAAPGYHATIAQPDARSDFIRMDADVYNAGEVVEFTVTNNGTLPLECSDTPPGFRVKFQTGSGRWVTRMGPDTPVKGNSSQLKSGESTQLYRFVSAGWEPGRYRIISDCGVEHDILIHALMTVTPTLTACPSMNTTNTTLWIEIDPISDQIIRQPFTIQGTTTLRAGTQLNYTIFSVTSQQQSVSLAPEVSLTTIVQEGSCGTNTWSASGEVDATGYFMIGIADKVHNATAIKRFMVTS